MTFFSYFFCVGSAALLIATLMLIRNRDPRLGTFGATISITAVMLMGGALLRLFDPAGIGGDPLRRLADIVTFANLSATSILLIRWTIRVRRGAS